jgi:hypothetical protein
VAGRETPATPLAETDFAFLAFVFCLFCRNDAADIFARNRMKIEDAVFVWDQFKLLAVVERLSPEHARWVGKRNSDTAYGCVRFGGLKERNIAFAPPGGALGFLLAEVIVFLCSQDRLSDEEREWLHFELAKIDEYRACAEAGPWHAHLWGVLAWEETRHKEAREELAQQLGRWELEDDR